MSNAWMKFYPQDWRSDEKLRLCSLAARGLWIEMLAIMHRSERYGTLLINGILPSDDQLAIQIGAPADQVAGLKIELAEAGVFSCTAKGIIYSRRMIRDEKKAKTARENGKTGGNPKLCKTNEKSASDKGQDKASDKGGLKPQKPEARSQTLSSAMAKVCTAAGMTAPPGDMYRLEQWIGAGADLDRDILPIVERTTKRLKEKRDRPQTFKLFETDVLAAANARRADDDVELAHYEDIRRRYPGPSIEPAFGGYGSEAGQPPPAARRAR